MGDTAVDLLLEYLKQVMNCKEISNRISEVGNFEIESLYKYLSSFRTFMSWYNKHKKVKDGVVMRVTNLANEAKFIIGSLTLSEIFDNPPVFEMFINVLIELVKVAPESEIYDIGSSYSSSSLHFNSYLVLYSAIDSSSRASIDFLLKFLKQLIYFKEIPVEKLVIESLYEDVISLRTFLIDSEMMSWYKHKELKDLVFRITDMANEAQDIIDSSIVRDFFEKKDQDCVGGNIFHVHHRNEIKSLKKEVSEIYEKKLYYGIIIRDPQVKMYSGSSSSSSSIADLPIVEEETIVGFDNDVETIRERLAGGGSKQLDVISIVGMAGLGKTTLAKKLYNDEFVAYHFYIRGWTYVSQVYTKRDLLLSILSSVVRHRDELYTMSDEKLGEELYKRLKGNIYLIVMDDMWDTKAWDIMKIYFPNDNNGSRIIITSRLSEVALHAKPESPPHLLHLLTKDESWDLLKQKVFGKGSCTPDLVEIGENIAQKCQGLPLAIVVVAGLLARTNTEKKEWEKVSGSLSSHIAGDLEQCMNNTLELSYYHLPRHLRLCFLYFGAFPEDYEIRVRKLIWLWIAEGFIHQIGQKTLEDVAEEYLTDLIGRSLVLVATRKFSGGIKACRVHDLLRDLCLRKGKEENFMQQIYIHETFSSNYSFPMTNNQLFMLHLSRFFNPSSSLIPIGEKQRRLCIFSHGFEYISLKPCAPHIRSLLCVAPTWGPRSQNISCICRAFKLLRVLDLSAIRLPQFPSEILQLVLLRYLELRGSDLTLPESISELLNLETLDVYLSTNFTGIVPPDIWKMVNLRHLRIDGKNYASLPSGNDGYPSVLHNLQTISQLSPKICKVILARTPNLRNLGIYGRCVSEEENLWFPDLHFLNHLEKLELRNTTGFVKRCSLQGFNFPPNLRRLNLSGTQLDWEEMSIIGMLCNLEVLKLRGSAFVGPRWETTGGGFQRLKFLRLEFMEIEQWEASDTDFPSLQQLVLHGCRELEGIPLEIGNIPTLQRIEVDLCNHSAANSAKEIQEEQQSMGNDSLKILIGYVSELR